MPAEKPFSVLVAESQVQSQGASVIAGQQIRAQVPDKSTRTAPPALIDRFILLCQPETTESGQPLPEPVGSMLVLSN